MGVRKKLIALLVLVALVQPVCFASIDRKATENSVSITSSYLIEYEETAQNESQKNYLWVNCQKYKSGKSDAYSFSTMLSYSGNNPKFGIVFSKSDPYVIRYDKNGNSHTIKFENIIDVGNNHITFVMEKNTLQDVFELEKVFLVFPASDGKNRRTFEIPKEILAEWKTVVNSDLIKIKRELI